MVDWDAAANYAEVLGLLALVLGGAFAWFQIVEARKAQHKQSSLRVLASFLDDVEWMPAMRHIASLPIGWHERKKIDAATMNAVDRFYTKIEMLGYFVHENDVAIEQVHALAGGGLLRTWQVIRPFAEQSREEGDTHAFEWVEWLMRQMEALGDRGPAHLVHV